MAKSKYSVDNTVAALHRFDIRYQTAKQAIDAIKWIALAYFSFKAIDAIAGKITLADIKLSAVLNPQECSCYTGYYLTIIFISLLIAWFGIIYGRRESKLRKDTVEKMAFQIKTLQSVVDPNRTSSLLTSRGETSAKDKR